MNREQMNGAWCTKDDMLQDLALATGCELDIDEHCLVYGERPPPRPKYDIDDEMKILFDDRLGDVEGDQKFVEPDLKGIMSMIRMVETEEEENISPIAKPTDIIVISKLSPNVREFIPKSRASQTETLSLDADKKTTKDTLKCMTPSLLTDQKTTKDTLKSMTPHFLADTKTTKDTLKCMTPSLLADTKATKDTLKSMTPSLVADQKTTKDTLKSMTPSPLAEKSNSIEVLRTPSSTTEAEMNSLKDKILSKPSDDPYKHRREKNAAIATLLRHCTTPPITKNVKEKPIKLYTPDFFERCKATEFKGTDDNSTEVNDDTEESISSFPLPTEEAIKEPTMEAPEIITKETKENNDIEHTNLTPNMDENLNLDEPTSSFELVEQQKSISKVNEWLDGPKPQKKTVQKPVMLAGSIAYKRKEVMSPSSTTSATIDKKISKHDIKAYVPSNYATELRMKYEKKKKEATKPLNIWDNLEDQLKKKDEEMKKKSRDGNV